ncbi:putative bifunctional diguanylate cyclase/phosphodiesterase [Alishewanella sp. d11]|uniref:putative bifunctional diguanylate cyclase/phosphodiesterase n=1 Tax=Alishewanella sp. d11 TaxID=3414030 RepID=UPI003BF7C110
MNSLFLLAVAIQTVVGISLLFAWQRNKNQGFVVKLGLSFIGVAALVLIYTLFAHAAADSPINLYVIPFVACITIYLLVAGVTELSGYRMSNLQVFLFFSILLFIMVTVSARSESVSSQVIVSLIYLLVGVLAFNSLKHRSRSHQLIGPLLILLALHPLISISGSPASIELQFAAGTVIRTAIGFAALYVSVDLAAKEARALNERFTRLTEYSVQGVAVVSDHQLLYTNSATLKIYGAQDVHELKNYFLVSIEPNKQNQIFWQNYKKLMSGEVESLSWQGPRARVDGQIRDLLFFAYKVRWDHKHAICVLISDETERMETTRQVLYRATHDNLTGLPNRHLLIEQLSELMTTSEPHSRLGVFILNIDRFKLFNTAHGFSLGDEILQSLATLLQEALASIGTIFHIGIDEFVVLTRVDVHEDLTAVEQALIAAISKPLKVSIGEFYVDMSIGCAIYPDNGNHAEQLIRAASSAMYLAKTKPGTQLIYADSDDVDHACDLLNLEQALRVGIKQQEIFLCYQPKVDSVTQQLLGFEALARWNRQNYGLVSPQKFIQAAENTGLIVELGTLIIRIACQQIAQWRAAAIDCVPVAVNVSPLQLLNSQFPDIVMNILNEFKVPVHLLTLEITESAAIDNLEQTQNQLNKLKELGVSIAMDDFGTGFSSLSMLRQLPLSSIKIDKALIDPLPEHEGTAVVHAICQLADALGLRVVAEGVETQQQADAAKQAGCHEFQGYFFGKPLHTEDALALLLLKK